jgi:hypothetical protein
MLNTQFHLKLHLTKRFSNPSLQQDDKAKKPKIRRRNKKVDGNLACTSGYQPSMTGHQSKVDDVKSASTVVGRKSRKNKKRGVGPYIESPKKQKSSVLDEETGQFLATEMMKSLSWNKAEEKKTTETVSSSSSETSVIVAKKSQPPKVDDKTKDENSHAHLAKVIKEKRGQGPML